MRAGDFGRLATLLALSVTLAHCGRYSSKVDPKYGVAASPRVVAEGQQVPKGGGTYRVGKPYVVAGRTYVPEENTAYSAEGIASWYGNDFHGRLTANGEVYDMHGLSAAHPTLPMPSYVRVTNLRNNRSVVVRVNDRGPYHADRVIDLSAGAARLLDVQRYGVARVRVEYVGRAALSGSDDVKLAATLRHGTPAPSPSQVRVASARLFVPEYFDPNPIANGPIPTPPDRPFDLGETDARTAAAARRLPVTAEVSAARQPRSRDLRQPQPEPLRTAAAGEPAAFAARFGHVAGEALPPIENGRATAFAPAPSMGAVLTGRGLY